MHHKSSDGRLDSLSLSLTNCWRTGPDQAHGLDAIGSAQRSLTAAPGLESGQRRADRLGPTPFPQATTPAKGGQGAQERNRPRRACGRRCRWKWRVRVPLARKDTDLCTPEAAGPIGKFIVKMIVIHVGENTIPIDIAVMSMTHVQVFVGQQHTIISAGTKYAKTVKRISE